jgi:N-acetylneuraminate synthase/N,N'-diacetyllegionaminate synthase
MQIHNRSIDYDHPPYIIAEIGVNHDGDLDRCLALTQLAHDAGADAVKFQLFDADLLMSASSRLATYQREAGESDPREMLRRLQLSSEQLARAAAEARRLGVHAIVSVFSVELVARAEMANFDAYKTASPDIVHKPLLDALRATGKPLIVSTGAATLAEVSRAITWLTREGTNPSTRDLALLQCVSSYPTPIENAALGGIMALRDLFAGPVGYSDHTAEDSAGALAVACGACILEKHFTDDRARIGPDHRASLDAHGFKNYIKHARRAWQVLREHRAENRLEDRGTRDLNPEAAALIAHASQVRKEKIVLEIEQDVRAVSRQSIVTRHPLAAGHVLTRADVTFKRPGLGLLPFELESALGRTLVRAIDADTPIHGQDLDKDLAESLAKDHAPR